MIIMIKLPVMPEKDVISLIVESYDTSSSKLRYLMEQGAKHSTNHDSCSGFKICSNNLWAVARNFFPVPLSK